MTLTQSFIDRENTYGSKNYAPLPVVLAKGEGIYLWDVEGKKYFDFLSGYSVMNQGHGHPRILNALIEQAKTLTQVSRALHSDQLAPYAEFATKLLGFQRILPLNTGVEAVEAAIKLARKWAVKKKGLKPDEAKIIFCADNFHGRTMAAISASTSPGARQDFGPFVPNFLTIPFGSLKALEEALQDPSVAAFLFEPIQGEAGVVVPPEGFLRQVRELCTRKNVLMIADEIQTGLGRTGRLLACHHEGVKPDILLLGKALGGGVLPASGILADDDVMLCFQPGDHGSTFGGNPLACAVAKMALQVIHEENLAENAEKMGHIFREELRKIKNPRVKEVRGKGLLNAVVIEHIEGKPGALEACMGFIRKGLIAKNTRENVIRFAPPLTIQEPELRAGTQIIREVLEAL